MNDIIVIKIGGSLLNEPGALALIREWLETTRQPGQTRLLLAGGGGAVDALRSVDAANPLPAADTHWAAIGMMDTHTRLLPTWLSTLRATETLPSNAQPAADWAFVCEPFLREIEPHLDGERLAIGWDSTSDAIAARLAEVVGGRLVLLKHTLDPTPVALDAASKAGVIDPVASRHAAGLVAVELLGVLRPGLPLGEAGK